MNHVDMNGPPAAADISPGRSSLKQEVRRFWDNLPCGVKTTDAPPGSRQFFEAVERHRYAEEFHIPEVVDFASHSGRRVLEIGGGLGTDGRRFAQAGARYVDADLSISSLRLARGGFELFGLPGAFLHADAENLPFRDGAFDLVYSHGVLHHTPDTPRTIREVHRVLRPAGRAIVMLYARESAAYLIGVPIVGRLRLVLARQRMGRAAFNRMVGLPPDHRGRIPHDVVINNSTDGLGNPLSQFFSERQIERLFRDFGQVSLEKHYFHRKKIPIVGRFLPRPALAWLGRRFGGYWYVKATK